MLALLLARVGIPVTLLEEHRDFDRDFRGDTIHPAVMRNLQEIGLDRRLLKLSHTELRTMTLGAANGPLVVNFGLLKTPYPFITLMPQKRFLEFVTGEAARYASFQLVMGARVEALITDGNASDGRAGVVRGVRYRGQDGWHEVRALVTVGCDGRFSWLRRLGSFTADATSSEMDVLWFRLPRRMGDPQNALARVANGHFLVLLDRDDQWQIATVIAKGSYAQVRVQGIETLRQFVVDAAPELADRVDALTDWKQVALLSIASDRLRRWYRPGLLLIGDAAHTMSPVGGVGINYAIQDAVLTANTFYGPLRAGRAPTLDELASVQRRRALPTRIIQAIQAQVQRLLVRQVLAPGANGSGGLRVPEVARLLLRTPGIRALPPLLIGIGVRPVHVAPELRTPVDEVAPSPPMAPD